MVTEKKILTGRLGQYAPLDAAGYQRLGGMEGLRRALAMTPEEVIEEVKRSGLIGRGGAGFPTGPKWQYAAQSAGGPRILICNADEGELGTHKDRVLLEGDPWSVLEGMLIAAYAIGAPEAWIYINGQYEGAFRLWEALAETAEAAGLAGDNILGSAFSLRLRVASGRGLYIAGEELALIASLEMRRPMSRLKPPFPTERGLFDRPTVVNNVETLANVSFILARGAAEYRRMGTADGPGTRMVSLSGDVRRPGVFEIETGAATLGELIEECGGGTTNGRPVKAVQPGGGTSALLPGSALSCPLSPAALRQAGSSLGTAGLIVYEEGRNAAEICKDLLDYYAEETCGRCAPCRIGLSRMREIVGRLLAGEAQAHDVATLRRVARVCVQASNCGLGQAMPNPIVSALDLFPRDFEALSPAGASR